jgi:hypothetical protein
LIVLVVLSTICGLFAVDVLLHLAELITLSALFCAIARALPFKYPLLVEYSVCLTHAHFPLIV